MADKDDTAEDDISEDEIAKVEAEMAAAAAAEEADSAEADKEAAEPESNADSDDVDDDEIARVEAEMAAAAAAEEEAAIAAEKEAAEPESDAAADDIDEDEIAKVEAEMAAAAAAEEAATEAEAEEPKPDLGTTSSTRSGAEDGSFQPPTTPKGRPKQEALNSETDSDLGPMRDVEVEVRGVIFQKEVTIGELGKIEVGTIVKGSSADDPLLVQVGEREVAKGRAVVVEDRYGVLIDELVI